MPEELEPQDQLFEFPWIVLQYGLIYRWEKCTPDCATSLGTVLQGNPKKILSTQGSESGEYWERPILARRRAIENGHST